MHAPAPVFRGDHAQQPAGHKPGDEATRGRVRPAKFDRDLCNVARAAIGKEIERRNLGEREIGRRQLLGCGEDELAPEAPNRDDPAADLAEALAPTRDLVHAGAERNSTHPRKAAAQLVGRSREVG